MVVHSKKNRSGNGDTKSKPKPKSKTKSIPTGQVTKKQKIVGSGSKKATSQMISKLDASTDVHELISKIASNNNEREKAFDNVKQYHEKDLKKKESEKHVENDMLKQLEKIGEFNI